MIKYKFVPVHKIQV